MPHQYWILRICETLYGFWQYLTMLMVSLIISSVIFTLIWETATVFIWMITLLRWWILPRVNVLDHWPFHSFLAVLILVLLLRGLYFTSQDCKKSRTFMMSNCQYVFHRTWNIFILKIDLFKGILKPTSNKLSKKLTQHFHSLMKT